MFTTNLQIHIVTCCIHLRIHHTSRILFLFHSFSDFVAYVVTTLIFPKNQKQWANFSIHVAILFLWFKRATTAPNKQIDSQHYKRLKMKTLTTSIHSHNHAVKSIILKNFKLLQNDSETGTIFSQPPLISFKRDKNIGNFLVRSSFQTNDQSGTFKCVRSRCKTCPFIHSVKKISGPKRSIKITDHFAAK